MPEKAINELGPLQARVMDLLWEAGEATVRDVQASLEAERPDGEAPAYTTVLTTMQKLEKAGWLTYRRAGRAYVYRPARSRDEEGGTALQRLVAETFRGDAMAAFQHLLADGALDADELDRLQGMVDEARRTREATTRSKGGRR